MCDLLQWLSFCCQGLDGIAYLLPGRLFPGGAQTSRTLHRDLDAGHFTAPAVNGCSNLPSPARSSFYLAIMSRYERLLRPPRMVMDCNYWLNQIPSQVVAPVMQANCIARGPRPMVCSACRQLAMTDDSPSPVYSVNTVRPKS